MQYGRLIMSLMCSEQKLWCYTVYVSYVGLSFSYPNAFFKSGERESLSKPSQQKHQGWKKKLNLFSLEFFCVYHMPKLG